MMNTMDLNRVLKKEKNSLVCNVDNMVVYISRHFEKYMMLNVSDNVSALAIFEITVGKESTGFFLPAVVTMSPSSVKFENVNGDEFVRCEFNKGDIFIDDVNVVQNPNIAYVVFEEFIDGGRVPKFMRYDNLAFVFDIVKKITSSSIPAEHAAFEMIYAYLSRDPKNFRQMWRLTQMNGDPKYFKLKDVPHVAVSTSSKLISAYLKDSIASSMVNASEDQSDIEDLLRH